MPRKNTPAPFKSSCFTETSRIAAGTLLLTEFARWHPGAPASRASGGFTAPDFLSLHSACIQVALLYFCEHFANSPLGRSAERSVRLSSRTYLETPLARGPGGDALALAAELPRGFLVHLRGRRGAWSGGGVLSPATPGRLG